MSRYLYKVNDAFLSNSKFILYTPGPSAKKLPFQVMACGHFYATGSYDVEREGLYSFLLILTLSGTGEIEYENRRFGLSEGKAVFIDCSKYHQYKTVGDIWEILWVRFNCNPEIDYMQILNGDSFEPISLDNKGAIEKLIDKILQLTQSHEPTADLVLSNLISAILTELGIQKFQQSTVRVPSSAKKIVVETVSFFETHYATNINIQQLAENFHMSQYSFIRLFKKQTGLTPYEFLLKTRITEAKFLLEQSDSTIDQISFLVGFNNENNFIRKFKLLTGTTPLKYRNLTRINSI